MWPRYENSQNGKYFDAFPILAIDLEIADGPLTQEIILEYE